MFPTIEIFVPGIPAGQPRIKAARRGRFVTIYTPKKVKDAKTGKYHVHPCVVWKKDISCVWRGLVGAIPKIETPVCLTLVFSMPRPKSHFNSKGVLKPSAPHWHAQKPDADNLAKAVMDCLTELGVWEDDDQVVILKVVKQFADGGNTGCQIALKEEIIF